MEKVQQQQQAAVVFAYSYIDQHAADNQPAAFTLNFYTNNLLCFQVYNNAKQVIEQDTFQVHDFVRERIMRMISYALPWLTHVPPMLECVPGRRSEEHTFLFHSIDGFRIYDLRYVPEAPFGSRYGRYARRVLGLLEDCAIVLAGCGFQFTPRSFDWDHERLIPLEAQMYQSANQPAYHQA